jgi:uncharacterized protein
MPFSQYEKDTLLKIARKSIEHGLECNQPLEVNPADHLPKLRETRATFVSLHRQGRLRGCIGVIEACRPLISDVAHSAFYAAFMDHRFSPLGKKELEDLEIEISVLTPSERIQFSSEQDLLHKLRPGVDGLNLSDGPQRGTFLPIMWEQLPTPAEFLHHLKIKAGLAPDYWSDTLEVSRFTAELIA